MMKPKAIFITGGASGIGRAVARHFAEAGWFVGIADIDEAGMAETLSFLPPGAGHATRLDVRDRAGWDIALADFAAASGGRINVVHNNAGVPLAGPLVELTSDEIDRTLDINLRGAIIGSRASYPWLEMSAPGSCLINTASAAALYGMANQSIYGMTKAGLRSLTETLAIEWEPVGIRVCAILPGFVDTPLLSSPPNARSHVPIRETVRQAGLEFTPVEEVARAVWNAVHGQHLHVLVGRTARQMAFAARWAPALLRARSRKLMRMRRS